MKNVIAARGGFSRCGHGVITALESHFHNGGLAPCRLAREGAITMEVMIAVNACVSTRRKETSFSPQDVDRICKHSKRFLAHPVRDAKIADMKTIINFQPPKRFTHATTAECLRKILSNQEVVARTFWEAFQSLGYRLDKHDIAFESIRDHLWKIEHPADYLSETVPANVKSALEGGKVHHRGLTS